MGSLPPAILAWGPRLVTEGAFGHSASPPACGQCRESDTLPASRFYFIGAHHRRRGPMSFVTHVECTVCGAKHDAMRLLTVCEKCGQMLAVRYDLERVKASVTKEAL